jgi:hypothetical protein
MFNMHRLLSTGSRWDIRWVRVRGNTWYIVYIAYRLHQSVLRLAVRVVVFSAQVVRRHRVSVFEGHRLP